MRNETPCVALCSTALGDNVCRGCARTFEEISAWCLLDDAAREAVWQCLPERHWWLRVASLLGKSLEIRRRDGVEWGELETAAGWKAFRRVKTGWLIREATGEWLPVGEMPLEALAVKLQSGSAENGAG